MVTSVLETGQNFCEGNEWIKSDVTSDRGRSLVGIPIDGNMAKAFGSSGVGESYHLVRLTLSARARFSAAPRFSFFFNLHLRLFRAPSRSAMEPAA